jgi:two-component system chemotaxis sensor kinase CheA
MSENLNDKALQDFLSEAQETIESFNRALLALDSERAAGRYDPEVMNAAFRAVHSLKGLSGLFGVQRMTHLAHSLENLLDSLRLGRVDLTPDALDLLFESVGVFNRMIAETAQGALEPDQVAIEDLTNRLARVAIEHKQEDPQVLWGGFRLDPSVLSVLTEYEEHRLRENVKAGRTLYKVHAGFRLATIDKDLDALKVKLKSIGEAITYLPSAESSSEHEIELDVLLGSTASIADIEAVLVPQGCTISAIPKEAAAKEINSGTPVTPVTQQVFDPEAEERARATILEEVSELSLRSVAQTVRVDIRKLDGLMNIVGELGLARAGIQSVLDGLRTDREGVHHARPLHRELRTLSRKLDELQAGVLEVRMVPLGQVFDKLSRVVRKISRDANKEIRLIVRGAETELDKLIVEELSDPLMHIIRNCIDHGIEHPEVREKLRKSNEGTVTIAAEQRGNHVVISIEDDGAGLDERKLVERAVERGVVEAAEARDFTPREIHNLIFLPGVSTKDVADELSGRGVGMDVVKTNIARLSGIIDIDSVPGRGTRLLITLPITLAIIKALVIRTAGRTFALPLNTVLESLRISVHEIRTIERREVMSLRGHTLPLARLERLFDLDRASEKIPDRHFVVVVGMAQHRIGLLVDELVGQEDIVIKSLGAALEGIPGIAGATELGGKKTVLVLDVAAIVEEAVSYRGEAA